MAFELRCSLYAAIGTGAHSGRTFASRPDIDTSPHAFVRCSASVNGAVQEVAADVWSPRCPRNMSLRRVSIGCAIMKSGGHICATRAVRFQSDIAAGRVARACFGRMVSAGAALSPNPAFERTRRFMFSFWAGVAAARRST